MMKMIGRGKATSSVGDHVGAYDWDDIVAGGGEKVGSPARFDVEQLVIKYCTPDYISSYPYAESTLTQLADMGLRLAVVTNGFYKYQNPVMEGLGLRHFFEDFITPEMVGTVKPYAAIYHATIKGEHSLKLHVGDTIIHDVWGAARRQVLNRYGLCTTCPIKSPIFFHGAAHSREIEVFMEKSFQSDLSPEAYPEAKVEDCRPVYDQRPSGAPCGSRAR